jgi:hypothetical protein
MTLEEIKILAEITERIATEFDEWGVLNAP